MQVDSDARKALAQMSKTGSSRLPVVDGDRLVGMLVPKVLLRYPAFRVDLEEMEKAV